MLMQSPLQPQAVLSNLTTSASASVGGPAFQQLPCCPTQLTAAPNYHFAVCSGTGSAGVCLPSPNHQSRVYLGSMSWIIIKRHYSRLVCRRVYFDTVHSQLKKKQSSFPNKPHGWQWLQPFWKKRRRTQFSANQLNELEEMYKQKKYLSTSERAEFALRNNLGKEQVKVWFQNKRAKARRQAQLNAAAHIGRSNNDLH